MLQSHRSSTLLLAALCSLAGHFGLDHAGVERGQDVDRLREQLASAEQALHDGQWAQAETLYADTVDQAERLSQSNLLLGRALDGLAEVRCLQGRGEEAVLLYLRAIKVWESILGPQQPRLAVSLHNLGAVYLQQGKLEEARTALERALAIWELSLGANSREAEEARKACRSLELQRQRPQALID